MVSTRASLRVDEPLLNSSTPKWKGKKEQDISFEIGVFASYILLWNNPGFNEKVFTIFSDVNEWISVLSLHIEQKVSNSSWINVKPIWSCLWYFISRKHNNVVRRKIRAEKIKSSLNPGGLETKLSVQLTLAKTTWIGSHGVDIYAERVQLNQHDGKGAESGNLRSYTKGKGTLRLSIGAGLVS